MEEVARRWWNGCWGRLARRDVWLVRQTRWKLIARAGDSETGKVLRWEFDTEQEALHMVDRLLRADTAGQWREQDPTASQAAQPREQRPGRRPGPARS